MSRKLITGFCFSLTMASTAFGQAPKSATRLGPESLARPSGPRVVEVQASEPVRAASEAAARPVMEQPAPTMQQQIAAARSEVANRQLNRLAPYNQYALPGAAVYMQSQVLPPAGRIRPERTGAPVQLFQPGSTFSHVIERAAENRRLANLEVEAEAARAIDARDKTTPETPETPDRVKTRNDGSGEPRSIEAIDAELAFADARLANARRRLARLQSLSQATYSQLYQNLGDKILLEIYENELQLESLAKERNTSSR